MTKSDADEILRAILTECKSHEDVDELGIQHCGECAFYLDKAESCRFSLGFYPEDWEVDEYSEE